jgi:hypothetical protein
MRNYLADYDQIAVSANVAETALNTEQTLDTSMLVAKSTVIQLEPRREHNGDELTGKEEPDTVYDLGSLSNVTLEFPKAQAQHFAFAYAFGLGSSSPAAWGTGYKHTIMPVSDMILPSFTAGMQLGSTILKRRFASLHADSVKATFAKDSWAKVNMDAKGTGKNGNNIYSETVTAAYNADELTLAANAVEGATPSARLDNVHQVRVLVPNTGEYEDVTVTAVSDAGLAVLAITAPATAVAIAGLSKAASCVVSWAGHGLETDDEVTIAGITQVDWTVLNATHEITKIGIDSFSIPVDTSAIEAVYNPTTDPGMIQEATETTYEILYVPEEAAWCTFPSRETEPPLRVTDLIVVLGGKWNGTAILGGHAMSDEIESIEHTLNNQMMIESRPGGTGSYANYAIRQGRMQTLAINRQARDYILQQRIADNEYFAVYMKATGAEFEAGKNYYVEMVFPRCAVLKAPISVNGKILAEAGDLIILEDDTYGSIQVQIGNKVAAYAA